MYRKIDNCPICKYSKFENKWIAEDHTVTHESFVIVACKQCGFHFTNPIPRSEYLNDYYESNDYISHTDRKANITEKAYHLVRAFTLKSKVKLINKCCNKSTKRLLDFGCGTGDFLQVAKKNKWDVKGVEPNSKAAEIAENKIGKEHILSSIEQLDTIPKKQDVITLWHVLEHVENLSDCIATLSAKLKKKGSLIIALPNRDSWDAQYYKENWAAWDVPRHLYHFNQKDVYNLAQNNHMRISKTLPMKWDAFYISLMSERYIHAKENYIKAIINGLKSNRYAKNNKNNYSSLIYILKKK